MVSPSAAATLEIRLDDDEERDIKKFLEQFKEQFAEITENRVFTTPSGYVVILSEELHDIANQIADANQPPQIRNIYYDGRELSIILHRPKIGQFEETDTTEPFVYFKAVADKPVEDLFDCVQKILGLQHNHKTIFDGTPDLVYIRSNDEKEVKGRLMEELREEQIERWSERKFIRRGLTKIDLTRLDNIYLSNVNTSRETLLHDLKETLSDLHHSILSVDLRPPYATITTASDQVKNIIQHDGCLHSSSGERWIVFTPKTVTCTYDAKPFVRQNLVRLLNDQFGVSLLREMDVSQPGTIELTVNSVDEEKMMKITQFRCQSILFTVKTPQREVMSPVKTTQREVTSPVKTTQREVTSPAKNPLPASTPPPSLPSFEMLICAAWAQRNEEKVKNQMRERSVQIHQTEEGRFIFKGGKVEELIQYIRKINTVSHNDNPDVMARYLEKKYEEMADTYKVVMCYVQAHNANRTNGLGKARHWTLFGEEEQVKRYKRDIYNLHLLQIFHCPIIEKPKPATFPKLEALGKKHNGLILYDKESISVCGLTREGAEDTKRALFAAEFTETFRFPFPLNSPKAMKYLVNKMQGDRSSLSKMGAEFHSDDKQITFTSSFHHHETVMKHLRAQLSLVHKKGKMIIPFNPAHKGKSVREMVSHLMQSTNNECQHVITSEVGQITVSLSGSEEQIEKMHQVFIHIARDMIEVNIPCTRQTFEEMKIEAKKRHLVVTWGDGKVIVYGQKADVERLQRGEKSDPKEDKWIHLPIEDTKLRDRLFSLRKSGQLKYAVFNQNLRVLPQEREEAMMFLKQMKEGLDRELTTVERLDEMPLVSESAQSRVVMGWSDFLWPWWPSVLPTEDLDRPTAAGLTGHADIICSVAELFDFRRGRDR
ncbi:hypothetical protein PROFUN_08121 [Planoprotostelium fungivorum]|uniref:Uncharacterized protein n=1 Tax=Planoprotostelium fungivorum TaxID=1890364 RepID=A0A2P6MQD8_9EUKA|nr:hypothetical protein PROFUN_08121 [Planoprotostelium fungivorum]